MRKVLIAVGCGLLLSSTAWAGSLGIMGAYWDTDQASDDTGFGVKLVVDLGQSGWRFDLRGSFIEELTTDPSIVEGDFEAYPVDFGVSYGFNTGGGKVTPALGVGLSYVNASSKLGEVDDELGYYGILGLEFDAAQNFGVFVEVLYRAVDSQIDGRGLDLPFIGFDQRELELQGVGVNAGLALTW